MANCSAAHPDTIVIGAGIVGISTALTLQQAGYSVLLLDPAEPCSQTSYGNAGIFSSGSIIPLNTKGLWKQIPALLSSRQSALRISPRYALQAHRALFAFLWAGERDHGDDTHRRISALHQLIQRSLPIHSDWLRACEQSHRLRQTGWIKLYRQKTTYQRAVTEREIYDRYGIEHESLSSVDLATHLPNIKALFPHATWVKCTQSIDNPQAVGLAYFDAFQRAGGHYQRHCVRALQPHSTHSALQPRWRIHTETNTYTSDRVVVCAGYASQDLLKPLGIHLPMIAERGSHRLFHPTHSTAADILPIPIYDVDAGYVLSPMEMGLRLTSGVELSSPQQRFTFCQLNQLEPIVRASFHQDIGVTHTEEDWWGTRPTLPDSLPAIGETQTPGLWINTGHQHLGLTTAPGAAAELLTLLQANTRTASSPFSPQRFSD